MRAQGRLIFAGAALAAVAVAGTAGLLATGAPVALACAAVLLVVSAILFALLAPETWRPRVSD